MSSYQYENLNGKEREALAYVRIPLDKCRNNDEDNHYLATPEVLSFNARITNGC